MRERYDFIIVGGGSAGCALANRLTADGSNQVLVLEAGRPDYRWDVLINMPPALTMPIGNRLYDWKYESEPEPHMGGRRIYHARGKILGGSSSINGMIFQRGNPLDYERWAADPGMGTWDYAHCLPYFKRMETCLAGGDEYRGTDGPLVLERGPATSPLFRAFFEAVQQAGYELTDDVNGYRQEGFAPFDRNIHRGRRLSAARAVPAPGDVHGPTSRSTAGGSLRRILFEGRRAVGVELGGPGGRRIRAGEVIFCGGAFNSPQLLQLSGIGNAGSSAPSGRASWRTSPGSGENLQDHLEVYIQHSCTKPVSRRTGAQVAQPAVDRPASGSFSAGARGDEPLRGRRLRPEQRRVSAIPISMFHFLPIAIRYDGSAPAGGHGYQVHIGPMYSDARGSVKLKSLDPTVHPALRFNYLSTDQDRREWVEAIHVAREILSQSAFSDFDGGELSPGPEVASDGEILDWVARDGETALHPSCTCKMGTDERSVVDPLSLKVHGLDGLRVVDASVMPYVTNGNIYAPVMMMAEKAADLILGNTPLAPAPVEFYRHVFGVAPSD